MKLFIAVAAAGTMLVGCTSTESGRVQSASDGTRVYGLNDQPQSSVTGEGSLMPGAYSTRQNQTGQFTGQERTHDVAGQRGTPSRETDARELARTGPPEFSSGAGSLGQSGVVPDQSVNAKNLVSMSPGLTRVSGEPAPVANPPTMATAPTLAAPLASNHATSPGTLPAGAVGAPPVAQTGAATSLSNNTTLSGIPRADESLRTTVAPVRATENAAAQDLPAQIREALTTGRPGTITRLTPDEVQRFEIEALDGNVTLRGDVRSEVEKLMIGNKVAQMDGVSSVNNQLRVTGPQQAPGKPTATPANRPAIENGIPQ